MHASCKCFTTKLGIKIVRKLFLRGGAWHSYSCGQTVGWIKMPLGKEVGLGPGHIVLDGDPVGTQRPPQQLLPTFDPCLLWPNGRPSQQLLSSCFIPSQEIGLRNVSLTPYPHNISIPTGNLEHNVRLLSGHNEFWLLDECCHRFTNTS